MIIVFKGDLSSTTDDLCGEFESLVVLENNSTDATPRNTG